MAISETNDEVTVGTYCAPTSRPRTHHKTNQHVPCVRAQTQTRMF